MTPPRFQRTPAVIALRDRVDSTEAWVNGLDFDGIAQPDEGNSGDLAGIGQALTKQAEAALALASAVALARARGRSWTQIAAVLGVSKQAARERFGDA